MKFHPELNILLSDDGSFIKFFNCPNDIAWEDMTEADANIRQCHNCKKEVIDIKGMTEEEVKGIVEKDENACLKLSLDYSNITIIEPVDNKRAKEFNPEYNPKKLRVICTARDEKSINKAIEEGFTPLIKRVEICNKIHSKYAIIRSKKNGKIKVVRDFRETINLDIEKYEIALDWTNYYPYNFQSPYAAYLIPPDIKTGEHVFIDDVIEDVISEVWNQGDLRRLEFCEAIWVGDNLELLFSEANIKSFVG